MGVDSIAASTASASSAGTPGIVGQAEGTTWDPLKSKSDAKDDADMIITYGTRRTIQTVCGGAFTLLTAALMIFFLFFDAEAIIFGVSHCQHIQCRSGKCVELGDGAECTCPAGYSGATCESGKISGVVYGDSVIAGCSVMLGLSEDVTNRTALAHTTSSFDGSFALTIADVDDLILKLHSVTSAYKEAFVVVVPGDRCRGIGTGVYLSAPLVLRLLSPSIESDLVGTSLAITPLSTLAWSLGAETQQIEVNDAAQNAFDASGHIEYHMDTGSVNFLSRNCDARCTIAYCNSVKAQNTITLMQPFLNTESGGQHAWKFIVFAISDELARSTDQSYLTEEGSLNRIVQTARRHLLGETPSTAADSNEFQQLLGIAIGALSIANGGIDGACEVSVSADQTGTRAVTEAAQKRVSVIGPTSNETPTDFSSIVRCFEAELDAYRDGTGININDVLNFNDIQIFEQLVDGVVLPRKTVHSASGTIVSDGYFQNCRVYADLNRDKVWNADEEPSTTTRDDGRYLLVIAEPGSSLSRLVEPSCPVRLSQDQSPECTTSLQNRAAGHGLSGRVSDSVISPTTSLRIDTAAPNVDAIAQCIRSTERDCVESVILSTQIEITLWVLAALLDGQSCAQSCLQSNTWQTWETLVTSAREVMHLSGESSLSFTDAGQIVVVFNSALQASGVSDVGALESLATLASRLNSKAASEARELVEPIVCLASEQVLGSTCAQMAGTIDGGKAIIHLLRRQVLARDMQLQLATLVNEFSSEDQLRNQIADLESQREDKLPTLGLFICAHYGFKHFLV